MLRKTGSLPAVIQASLSCWDRGPSGDTMRTVLPSADRSGIEEPKPQSVISARRDRRMRSEMMVRLFRNCELRTEERDEDE